MVSGIRILKTFFDSLKIISLLLTQHSTHFGKSRRQGCPTGILIAERNICFSKYLANQGSPKTTEQLPALGFRNGWLVLLPVNSICICAFADNHAKSIVRHGWCEKITVRVLDNWLGNEEMLQ